MITKRADFTLIDIKALNKPSVLSVFKDQNLSLDQNILQDTIKVVTASQKSADLEVDGNSTYFDLEAEINSHPDSLFVKCFAIKADETNDNGDYFGREQLKIATPTFVGVPVFTNHKNDDINEARGKVVHSWWDDSKNGIMIIARVDAEAYPQLARGIKEQYILGTSMGASRGHDLVTMSDDTKKRVDELQVNDEVYTHSGNIEKVAAICETQEHNKLYHMKWSSNKTGLALSYEHPVLILQREDIYITRKSGKQYRKTPDDINNEIFPKFVPASEVKHNDYVLELINKNIVEDNKINEEIAFLLGVYAAEGYVSKKDNFVEFCFGGDDVNINKTIQYLRNNFKGKISEIDHTEDRNGYYVRIFNSDFASLCGEYIGTGSKNKRLHSNIKKWPVRFQKIFLGAYIDGDGCLVKERTLYSGHSSGVGAIQISSASLSLLKGVRQICLRIGCPATLSSHNRIASASTVMSPDTKYVEHILYITNTIAQKLKKYSHKANLSPEIKRPKFDSFFYKDYIAHRIKEVVVIDNNEPTYYVQVGDIDNKYSDHSYILNDIATHNCQVKHSLCSICHAYAESPDQYCEHVRERKTRTISAKNQKCAYHKHGPEDICPICGSTKKDIKTYAVQDQKVFEYNYGIKFIENSFVVNPACSDCGVTEVIDPQTFLAKVAVIQEELPRLMKVAMDTPLSCTDQTCIKIANQDHMNILSKAIKFLGEGTERIFKEAGQPELDNLQQALDLITSVSQAMLSQKDQIDLEFLSDLVKVLSDLQTVLDELTEQGYGRLPSPSQQDQTQAPQQDTAQQPVPPQTQPVSPRVQSGPAGAAGTVTAPMANKIVNLEKIANFIKKARKINLENTLKVTPSLDLDMQIKTSKKLDL